MASPCRSSSGGSIGQVPDGQLKKMVTEVFTPVIYEHVNLDVLLLGQMLTAGVLTENDVEEINNERDNKNNKAAVECLLAKFEVQPQVGVYSKFFQCLEKSENKSNRVIARYILEDGPYPNIKENFINFYKYFKELFSDLVANIYPSEILDSLNNHLSVDDQETILAVERQSGKSKSALVLLLTLSRSASDWPIDFVEACERSNFRGATRLREALGKDTASSASSKRSINHSLDDENQVAQYDSMDMDVMQFSEEHMETQESGDMEINKQDAIKPATLKTESSLISQKEEFGKLVLKVAEEIDGRDVQRLATLFRLSNCEEEQIMSGGNAGLGLIKALEVKGLVAANQMCPLYDGLTDVGLVKEAKIVSDYMEHFQEDYKQKTSEKGQEYHFARLLLELSDNIEKTGTEKLMTLFGFKQEEEDRVRYSHQPSLCLLKELERKGILKPTNVEALSDKLSQANFPNLVAYVDEYKNKYVVDVSSQLVKEVEESFGGNCSKQENSQTESQDGNSLGCISKYRVTLDEVGQALTKDDSVRLARLVDISNSEVDCIERHGRPSHEALRILEKTGKFSERNVSPLFDALEKLKLLKALEIVQRFIHPQIESSSNSEGEENTESKLTLTDDQRKLAEPGKQGEENTESKFTLRDDQRKLSEPDKQGEENTESKFIPQDDQRKLAEPGKQGEENTESKFILRDDQIKLAEPGKQGKNYIILAETGFGKTLVATDIIRDHLKDNTGPRKKKVAFIVEKKSLADQQEIKINESLGKQKEIVVKKVTGYDATVHLPTALETADVLVATAGVIHNEFRKINDSLTVFSLMIFDECHHCLKGHPFNQVMRMYHKEKREMISLDKSLENLPQVIGMTATLGTGQAKSLDKAVDHALHVMANLNTDHIETVEKSKEVVPRKIGSIHKDTTHIFVENREEDPFKEVVISLMSKVEEKLNQLPGANFLQGSQPFDSKDSQQYEQWVITNKEKHCPELVTDELECRNILACLEYLLIYHKALCINREVRSKDAHNFLKKFSDKQSSQSQTGNCTDLQWELMKEHSNRAKDLHTFNTSEKFENPLLKELENVFETEYTRNPDSLGLLFTATIEGTRYLKSWIEETPKLNKLLKTECVTRETTQNQLEQIRKKFENHTYNLLIVTSVADEGWSIDGLNLVFCLNYITSDYAAIQRPGRLRAQEGKYYEVGYGNLKKSAACLEIWKEMMEMAVKKIETMNPQVKKKKLTTFQAHDERLCAEVERRQELKASSKKRREFMLHCKKCQVEACSSYSIKRFKRSQHYIASQEFCDDKMSYKPHHTPCVIEDVIDKIGKLHCKKCGNDWGIVNRYVGQLFPVIKISSFTCRGVGEIRKKALKKWSEVPFEIDDVDSIEEDLFIETTP